MQHEIWMEPWEREEIVTEKNIAGKTHEKILAAALEVFSEKGYSAATVRDISRRADCNTVTVFRHFEDKQSLFLQVVERFHEFHFDKEELRSKLNYLNIHSDFRIIADYFFNLIYENIHIMRIFINDGHNFASISKHLWFVPDKMKDFVVEYLEAMYLDRIPREEEAILSEIFLCYIIRTCLRMNVHEGQKENSRQIAREAKAVLADSVDMIVNMVMLLVK